MPFPARVVVTGASGNVGSAVLPALLAAGASVVGVCRRPPEGPTPGVTWQAADLTDDASVLPLRRALAGADAVVHLAWGFQPSHRLDHLAELGVGGTRRVTEAVLEAGVPHLVHMSSVGTYAPKVSDAPVTEAYSNAGVPTSPYSTHKAAAESLLDRVQAAHPDLLVTRLRPGIIGQRSAGSALLRYGVPGFVPAPALKLLPVLPLDRRLRVPVVHAADVADAVVRVLDRRVGGPVNLASDEPITADTVGAALGAKVVDVPARAIRDTVAGLWHARLLQLDPGWIDLAYAVPLLDTGRAKTELDWRATRTGPDVLAEVVAGMTGAASGRTPVLRPRSVLDNLRRAVGQGPVHRRSEP